MDCPRIIIAGLRGGAGKTILSIGITAALKRANQSIVPFKKGPDYIDSGWLALAAGRPCYNLDTFLIPRSIVKQTFVSYMQPGDMAVIEGNRGLFDGVDEQGSASTADLSRLIQTPIILCVDCTKSTRTVAAVVSGCLHFEPDVPIKGVIINQVAGKRHETIIRNCIEQSCGIPVLGAIPKLRKQIFPERHMGLVPTHEHEWALESIDSIADIAQKYVNLDQIRDIARSVPPLQTDFENQVQTPAADPKPVRIGIIRDTAFQFYYPENVMALERLGAQMVRISPLKDDQIPDIDGLYIGGGFPETHARQLSQNVAFKHQIKQFADQNMPIYAECGGLMYLGESILLEGQTYEMAGVFPIEIEFLKRPAGHGYTICSIIGNTPYYKSGQEIRGHEFHYSKVARIKPPGVQFAFEMKRGTGIMDHKDGLVYNNVLATYTHIHSLGTPDWANNFVELACQYKKRGKE